MDFLDDEAVESEVILPNIDACNIYICLFWNTVNSSVQLRTKKNWTKSIGRRPNDWKPWKVTMKRTTKVLYLLSFFGSVFIVHDNQNEISFLFTIHSDFRNKNYNLENKMAVRISLLVFAVMLGNEKNESIFSL